MCLPSIGEDAGPSWHSEASKLNSFGKPVLKNPVVIPQRRPGSKERGFILAYPPELDGYDITQETFLDFIQECNKAVQGNAALMAVSVAGFGVGIAPEPISMIVGSAVQFGALALNRQVARWKTNTFMDKFNNEFFAPRGLMCFISVHDPWQGVTVSGQPPRTEVLDYRRTTSTSGVKKSLRDPYSTRQILETSHAVAPLVYPADDTTIAPENAENEGPKNRSQRLKAAYSRFQTFLDKRAQATYAAENPTDRLTQLQAPNEHKFRHRYLDPCHPAVNNGLVGLLSGGAITQDPEKRRARKRQDLEQRIDQERDQYMQRMGEVDRQNYSANERERQLRRYEEEFNARTKQERQALADLQGGVSERKIKKDTLYITIVPLPAEGDLRAASAMANGSNNLPPLCTI